jgi:hypothetical protein
LLGIDPHPESKSGSLKACRLRGISITQTPIFLPKQPILFAG